MSTLPADPIRASRPSFAMLLRVLPLFTPLVRRASRIDWLVRLAAFVLPVSFLAVVILQPWVEPKWMFLDPLTAAQLSGDCCHTHYGFVSMLGVMLWVTTAATALFAAIHLLATGFGGAVLRFAVTAGLLNGWLALDDAFLVHETVMPSLGVPQNAVLALYASLAAAYLVSNRKVMMAGDVWLIIMGGAALVASLAVDTLFHSLDPRLVLLEDSAKFFGIFCWATFHVSTLIKITIAASRTSEQDAR